MMGLLGLLAKLLAPPPRRSRRYYKTIERSAVVVEFVHPLQNQLSPTPAVARVEHQILKGRCWVIDGDTIVINKIHIRLAGIDAPELDHPWGQNAKRALMEMCRGQVVTAVTDGSISHERTVAVCHLEDGRDLSAEMVRAGLALDWKKYSGGRYRHLEVPGIRKKLWRADAKQKGRMPPAPTTD